MPSLAVVRCVGVKLANAAVIIIWTASRQNLTYPEVFQIIIWLDIVLWVRQWLVYFCVRLRLGHR